MRISDWSSDVCSSDLGDDRNIEGVAEADEARRLFRAGDVEHAGEHHRLVGDDADRAALDPAEAADDVGGVGGLDLEEIALVDRLPDQLVHIVGLVRAVRDQGVEAVLMPVPRIGRRPRRQVVAVGERQEIEEVAGRSEEHTSELQSLMRISYAVFCLKKKKLTQKIEWHITAQQVRRRTTYE